MAQRKAKRKGEVLLNGLKIMSPHRQENQLRFRNEGWTLSETMGVYSEGCSNTHTWL
jgi:hypothetical protein